MPDDAMFADIDYFGLVMATGVVSVLLWFMLNAVKRGHQMRIQRLRITIEEIRQGPGADEPIRAALDEALEHLKQAEDLGPFKGRGPLSAAHGTMAALVARLEGEHDVTLGS